MQPVLYRLVYEDILASIQGGEFAVGSRLPSDEELMGRFGVSAVTLRRALKMLREEGYIDRRPRRGTFVINNGSQVEAGGGQEVPTIGCIMPNFDDTFGTHVVDGLIDDSTANVVLKRSLGDSDREEVLARTLLRDHVQALVLQPSSSTFVPPVVLELVMQQFPVVIVDRTFDGVPVSSVVSDNAGGGLAAANYLIALGHTSLGLISSGSVVTTVRDRQRGFLQAHASARIPHDEQNEFHDLWSTVPGSDVSQEDDISKLRRFIRQRPDITGYVACEYNLAVLMREALKREGLDVPTDVSLISFDQPDTFHSDSEFRFTHIAQDQILMGQEAIRLIHEQMRQPGLVDQVVVPVVLKEEDSTARPS